MHDQPWGIYRYVDGQRLTAARAQTIHSGRTIMISAVLWGI